MTVKSKTFNVLSAGRRSSLLLLLLVGLANSVVAQSSERVPTAKTFETTFSSRKSYADPSDIDVDVIFSRGQQSWRVPAFWRGGNRWSVRFAPPTPGEYFYRIESADRTNPDLNGHERRVKIGAYTGSSPLLKRGAFRVSRNGRYFEHADGTPFYWLGDTWWTSLSDRLPWNGFRALTDDRKAKGFTVVMLSVMAPSNEEDPPSDPGFCNEGGCLWSSQFEQINPRYFDFADRRINYLVESGVAPVIVGAWFTAIRQMGLDKTKKLWRYIIARYGAYPVFWVAGGEIYDPPEEAYRDWAQIGVLSLRSPGWTEVVRYIRSTDPYRHPLSVHEQPPPLDSGIEDEALTDFDLFQASHYGWASIPTAIALLNTHYARTRITKPLVVGETGWETFAGQHFEDFQRGAFWTAMLNGAAGFSYGNAITGESYSLDKPFHRVRYSFLNWDEGMQLPAAKQIGLGAKLLCEYPWEEFVPRPDWVFPRGTTLLEPRSQIAEFDVDLIEDALRNTLPADELPELVLPKGEWRDRGGDFRLPYAAGIPTRVRVIYIPTRGLVPGLVAPPPTILDLEPGIRYRAYYWEPSLGVKIDLGHVQAKQPGEIIYRGALGRAECAEGNISCTIGQSDDRVIRQRDLLVLAQPVPDNVLASVNTRSDADSGLVLRYRDADNYMLAGYSAKNRALQFIIRRNGRTEAPLGVTEASGLGRDVKLAAEVSGAAAVVSMTDGTRTITSPIVDIPINDAVATGQVGLLRASDGALQIYDNFEVRYPGATEQDEKLKRKLYDASGRYRGELKGKGWDAYGTKKIVLMNAYRPERPPFVTDWVLVLEAA